MKIDCDSLNTLIKLKVLLKHVNLLITFDIKFGSSCTLLSYVKDYDSISSICKLLW